MSTLACYSLADSAEGADECSKAALFRRERQVGEVCWVFVLRVDVLGFVCVNLRDQRETFGFLLCGLIEYACVLFSHR